MRADQLTGAKVIDIAQGNTVGKVSGFLINAVEKRIVAIAVSGGGVLGRTKYARLQDISSIEYDVLTVQSEAMLLERRELETVGVLDSLVGRKVITEDGRDLGEVQGYEIDPTNGEIESLTFSASREALGGLWKTAGEEYTLSRDMIRTLGENVVVDRSTPDFLGIRKAA